MHWVKQKRENEGCDVTTVMIMLGQVCSCNWTNSGVSGYLWMVLGTSPKVAASIISYACCVLLTLAVAFPGHMTSQTNTLIVESRNHDWS